MYIYFKYQKKSRKIQGIQETVATMKFETRPFSSQNINPLLRNVVKWSDRL